MPKKPIESGLHPDFWNAMNHTIPEHEFGSVLLFNLLFNLFVSWLKFASDVYLFRNEG